MLLNLSLAQMRGWRCTLFVFGHIFVNINWWFVSMSGWGMLLVGELDLIVFTMAWRELWDIIVTVDQVSRRFLSILKGLGVLVLSFHIWLCKPVNYSLKRWILLDLVRWSSARWLTWLLPTSAWRQLLLITNFFYYLICGQFKSEIFLRPLLYLLFLLDYSLSFSALRRLIILEVFIG